MSEVSPIIAIIIVALLAFGSVITLLTVIGVYRCKSFYERLHMPGMIITWGASTICLASILFSYFVDHEWIFHEIILIIFLVITTPVSSMLLARAIIHRDRFYDWRRIPRRLLPAEEDVEIDKSVPK